MWLLATLHATVSSSRHFAPCAHACTSASPALSLLQRYALCMRVGPIPHAWGSNPFNFFFSRRYAGRYARIWAELGSKKKMLVQYCFQTTTYASQECGRIRCQKGRKERTPPAVNGFSLDHSGLPRSCFASLPVAGVPCRESKSTRATATWPERGTGAGQTSQRCMMPLSRDPNPRMLTARLPLLS